MAELNETVADVIEEVAEHTEEFADVVRSLSQLKLQYAAIGAVAGAAIGALAAYKVAYKKASSEMEREITTMREYYMDKIVVSDDKPELDEIVTALGYSDPTAITVKPEDVQMQKDSIEVSKNVFDEPQLELELPEWDYSVELRSREPERPYVIHRDEYVQSEPEYDNADLTYFEGDDVLCDERDMPIDNRDELVGDVNLTRFGHGSGDPNVMYIRNEALAMDIEITRSAGSFGTEVHGFTDEELQHSDRRRSRPRYDDE